MVKFTERDVAIIAGTAGVVDFLTEGRFSAPVARALKKAIRRFGPQAVSATARTIPRLAGTAIGATRFVAMKHPYIAAAVVTYEVIKNREQIAQLASEGWEVIHDTGQAMAPFIETEFERLITEGPRPSPGRVPPGFLTDSRPKKKSSAFNNAIKAGMAAVKKSTSYGGKGTIKPATKVFSIVTKLASAKKKKRKAPKSGIRRRIWNAMKGLR